MTKRAWILGAVAISAILSAGCSTLPRAREGSVEEVDALAGVELTPEELAQVEMAKANLTDSPLPAEAPPGVTEVSWTANGKNIQLTKLPPVQPVTASMLALDKRERLLAKPQERSTAASAPPRGLSK